MFSKIIDNFFIEEKVIDKDYVAKIHKVSIQYILNVGDKVHYIKYQGRGTGHYNARILDINKKGICIYTSLEKIVFLKWNVITKNKNKFEIEKAKSYVINFQNVQLEEFQEAAKQINMFRFV